MVLYYSCNVISYSTKRREGIDKMLDVRKFKAKLVENGITNAQMAALIGVSERTFYSRLKKKEFGSDEIEIMMNVLKIENPKEIFFASEVTL